jgi:hypothetical protein
MAQKIEVEFELKYKDAVKSIDKLKKEYSELEKEVVSANEKTAESLEKVEKGAKDGAKGIKKVGISIGNLAKASGIIFLLQKAFEFVSSAVQENQEVMDGLNTVFNTAQIIFNQVINAFATIYKSVSSTSENFDALGKVISGLITVSLYPLELTFYTLLQASNALQLGYEKIFGDEEGVKKAQYNLDKTTLKIILLNLEVAKAGKDIVNNVVEAVTEVGAIGTTVIKELGKVSVASALETAKTNIALKKSAEIASAQSRILLEQFDRQAELQRQIRDDETKSIAERQAANNELNTILDKQEKEMTKNAKLVKAAAQAQFDLTGKTEDYVAVLDAEAEVQAVAATVTGFRSEQQVNANALTKEATELKNAELESESLLSIEKKRFNAELIQDELLRLEKLKEIDLLEAEQETERLQAIVDNASAGTQAKVDAQNALDEFTEQSRQTNLTRDNEITQAKIANEKMLTATKQKALDDLIAIGGAETKFGKAMFLLKQALAIKEMIMEAKKTITFSSIAAAKSTVAVAEGTAQTAKVGFPQNIPLLIGYAAQAAGIISAIKSATGTAKSAVSGIGGGGGSIVEPSAPSAPPAFNVVGASGETQLADAIGGQTQRPARAYVVSNDVTTAQEMDRNIIEGASI